MSELMLKWSPLALSLINLVFYLVLWIVGRTLVSKRELDLVAIRVVHLEEISATAPGWGVLDQLKTRTAAIDGDLKAVGAQIAGLRDALCHLQGTLDLVQQHLLQQGESH
jgi:hypothetical protein